MIQIKKRLHLLKYNRFIVLANNFIEISKISFNYSIAAITGAPRIPATLYVLVKLTNSANMASRF
mgnify:CR=1 FL=1